MFDDDDLINQTKNGQYIKCLCHSTKHFYVITLPKIASSWLNDFLMNNSYLIDDSNYSLKYDSSILIDKISLDVEEDEQFSSNFYNFNLFKDDWYNLFNKNSKTKDYIFLIRNPIKKFISGIIQDVLLDNIDTKSTTFLNYFVNYKNKDNLTRFLELDDKLRQIELHWWTVDDTYFEDFVIDVVNHWVEVKVDEFFSNELQILQLKSDHKISNIFFIHKLLFNTSVNEEKIKILDIDEESIYDYITETYSIEIDSHYKNKINKLSTNLKNIMIKKVSKYLDIIEILYHNDILMYIDIYKKIYKKSISYQEVWKVI